MSETNPERPVHDPAVQRGTSDGLEERGHGAGRLLGEGAEQALADDEPADDDTSPESTADGD